MIFLIYTVEPKFSCPKFQTRTAQRAVGSFSGCTYFLHRWPLAVRQLRREVRECHSEGRLTGGGLVNGRLPSADDAKYADRATRGDVIGWFDPEEWHHGKGLESYLVKPRGLVRHFFLPGIEVLRCFPATVGSPWGPPWHQVGHVGPRARSPGEGSEEGHLAVQSYGRLLPGPRSALCEARGQRWEPPPVPNAAVDRADPWGLLIHMFYFFPRASERRVLPIVGVCISSSHLHIFSSSHLLIFTSAHLHICSSSHLLIFTSAHLLIFTSSHLLIFTSSHLHICSSSHLLIFASSHLRIFSSSHLLIFTSAHLHIFSSSHFLIIFTYSHPHIFTSSHLRIFSSSHLLIFTSSQLIFTSSHLLIFASAHLHIFSSSHLHIFTSSHLLLLPSCPLLLFYFSSEGGGRGSANETARNATLSHETRFDRQKLR